MCYVGAPNSAASWIRTWSRCIAIGAWWVAFKIERKGGAVNFIRSAFEGQRASSIWFAYREWCICRYCSSIRATKKGRRSKREQVRKTAAVAAHFFFHVPMRVRKSVCDCGRPLGVCDSNDGKKKNRDANERLHWNQKEKENLIGLPKEIRCCWAAEGVSCRKIQKSLITQWKLKILGFIPFRWSAVKRFSTRAPLVRWQRAKETWFCAKIYHCRLKKKQ